MTSLDRRAPIAGVVLSTFLAGSTLLPGPALEVYFAALPLALIWYLRTTINHARSFADILARLAEIERQINHLAGEDLLGFQSLHPSQSAVGGRTGQETVQSVMAICLILLLACLYLVHTLLHPPARIFHLYLEYLMLIGIYLIVATLQLRHYQYRKHRPAGPPLVFR